MKKVKIFGDSVLQGVYYDGRYHKTKDKINPENIELDNYSRMGNTIVDGIDNIKRHLDECDKDTYAILEYGGNDCNYNWKDISDDPDKKHYCAVEPKEYQSKLLSAINMIKETGAKVIIASPIPISAEKFMNFISKNLSYDNILKWLGTIQTLYNWQEYYAKLTEKIAIASNSIIMPMRDIFLQKNYEDLLCIDGIHPTIEGHEKIHRYIEGYLEHVV